MTEHDQQEPVGLEGAIVVELRPYQERRRVRGFATGLLLGYLAGAWLLPAAAELVEAWLTIGTTPSDNGTSEAARTGVGA